MRLLFCLLLVSSLAVADEKTYFIEREGKQVDLSLLYMFEGERNKTGETRERIPCSTPQPKNGIVAIDCSFFDGPVFYFDETTGKNISICPLWGCDTLDDVKQRRACNTECPPKHRYDNEDLRGLIEVTEPPTACDGQHAESIVGAWRVDPAWTRREYVKAHPEVTESSVMVGESGVMTITAKLIVLEIANIGQIRRAYTLIGGSSHRYLLEQRDNAGATATVNLDVVPCGLVMEAPTPCTNAFCENARDEVFKLLADKLGNGDAATLRRNSEAAKLDRIILDRVYYRQVVTER